MIGVATMAARNETPCRDSRMLVARACPVERGWSRYHQERSRATACACGASRSRAARNRPSPIVSTTYVPRGAFPPRSNRNHRRGLAVVIANPRPREEV